MNNLFQLLMVVFTLTYSQLCTAQTEPLPSLRVNDTWTYRQNFEATAKAPEVFNFRVSVIGDNKNGSLIAGRSGANGANPVWTLIGPFPKGTCLRDMMPGDSLERADICSTLLTAGSKWESNHSDSLSKVKKQFLVLGAEEVEVPFGRYMATKIEVDELNIEVGYPGVEPPPEGYEKHFHTIYWYAQEVRGFVRIIREKRLPDGTLVHKMTEELTHFQSK